MPRKKFLFVFMVAIIIIYILHQNTSKSNPNSYLTEIQRLKSLQELNQIKNTTKVFCWIGTHSPNLEKSLNTYLQWGHKFDKTLFVANTNSLGMLPLLKFPFEENRKNLWKKTIFAFRYIYTHFGNEFHWFMKADDDAFVVVENLYKYVSQFDWRKKYVFSRILIEKGVKFPSGGAGYIFSFGALKTFVEGFDEFCGNLSVNGEDVNTGMCLYNLNISLYDTRDKFGRFRFNPLSARTHLFTPKGHLPYWLYELEIYDLKEEFDCCAKDVISFHYMSIGASVELARILELEPKYEFSSSKFYYF